MARKALDILRVATTCPSLISDHDIRNTVGATITGLDTTIGEAPVQELQARYIFENDFIEADLDFAPYKVKDAKHACQLTYEYIRKSATKYTVAACYDADRDAYILLIINGNNPRGFELSAQILPGNSAHIMLNHFDIEEMPL